MRHKNLQCILLIFMYVCLLQQTCAFSALGKVGSKDIEVTLKCDPCPKGIHCVPPIQCPALVRIPTKERPQLCDLPAGTHGYCCTSGYNHTVKSRSHLHSNHMHTLARSFDEGHHMHNSNEMKQLRSIVEEARSEVAHAMDKEKRLKARLKITDPSFMHNLVFRSSHQGMMRAIDLSHRGMEQVYASRIYKKREHISAEDFELQNVDANLEGTALERGCGQQVMCPVSPPRFRTQDGTCNNPDPAKSTWGAAGTSMERLLPPSYEDGIWEPRTFSVDGSRLTNARTISRILLTDIDRPHATYNLLFMQFGQWITHDVTQSASITNADGEPVSCCSEDGSSVLPSQMLHYACLPIEIEPADEFYSQFNQGCINVVRSALSVDSECKLGYGKQLTKVTHFIDGSGIYGSDHKTQGEVRSFRNGMLRMSDDYGRQLLPLTDDKKSCGQEHGPCYFAGDHRNNQIISLTTLHTTFAREHNRIAAILGDLNRHWSDERIFYETRQIIIAKLQHIIFSEWLPYLIGTETMERFELNVLERGYSTDYDIEVKPSVTSEFTSAAFRYGHSTLDGKFIVRDGAKLDEIIDASTVMFNSGRLRKKNFYDEITNTLVSQPMQQVDSVMTHALSRYLFRGHHPFGLDLAAINIQRGREHGIRCYNDYLEATGHARIMEFGAFGYDTAQKLAQVYKHPDDIDLWVGGLLESPRGDAVVGPTFAEIIADQFSRFRKGDRYFYEHSPEINPAFLTVDQLREIKVTSMARILCDNADRISLHSMPPRAFVRTDVPGNTPVSCDNHIAIPSTNYRAWKEVKEY